MNLTPDSPELLAYALGELDTGTAATVEAQLAARPELAQAVAELRAAATVIGEAMARETAPLELTAEQHHRIAAAAALAEAGARRHSARIGMRLAAVSANLLLLLRAALLLALPSLLAVGALSACFVPTWRPFLQQVRPGGILLTVTACVFAIVAHWQLVLLAAGVLLVLPTLLAVLASADRGPTFPVLDLGVRRVLRWQLSGIAAAYPVLLLLLLVTVAVIAPLLRYPLPLNGELVTSL